ncbi:MAG TPA: hypothetical protein VK850_08885 [Candidatus Binatia bacterium]|nr:hypothetical protein [Candidatus Binatia bacterium]
MRVWGLLLGSLALLGAASASEPVRGLDQIKVLYLGDPGNSRTTYFQGFLKHNVGRIDVASREGFKPSDADEFDVVLLDWPQSGSTREDWKNERSPLGERDAWNKPTVLLGSAGLNLAVVWKVRGGSG